MFRAKFHKVNDIFGSKDSTTKDGKVSFVCKSHDPSLLPMLESDAMSCQGTMKVKDVLDYLLKEDGLFKYIKEEIREFKGKGPDYLRLGLQNEQEVIHLNPELSLDQVKKYLNDFIDIEQKNRQMPFVYLLKDPKQSKLSN